MKKLSNPKSTISSKALLIREIKQAIKELKLIKAGKKQARNAEEFLSEM